MSASISRRRLLRTSSALLIGAPAAGVAEAFSPWCLAFSPDGQLLAAGAEDGAIRIWDPTAGRLVRELRGHRDAVFGLAGSPKSPPWLLASCGRDAPRLRIWDVARGVVVRSFDAHPGWVWTVRFSPDGRRVATCGDDSVVRVFDAGSGERLLEMRGHKGAVKRVGWAAEGKRIVSAGDDGLLRVWDAATGAAVAELAGHTSWVEALACGPGGLVLTASADRTLRLWDVSAEKEARRFAMPVPDPASVAMSPDGKRAASGAADGSFRLWSVGTGDQLFRRDFRTTVLDVAFSPDGKTAASAHREEGVRLWRVEPAAERLLLRT